MVNTMNKINLNKNPKLMMLTLGVVIGIIITSVIVGICFLTAANKTKKVSANDENSSSVNSSSDSSINDEQGSTDNSSQPSAGSATEPPWSATEVYQGGAKISHNGSVYEAKWWTQNEEPSGDEASAWKLVGSATQSSENSSTSSNSGGNDMDSNLPVKEPTGVNDKGFKVIGYYPDWGPDKMDRLQMDILTHVNYSFAIPKNDGTLMPLEHPDNAKKLIKTAHQKDVKVLLAIGGWSYKDIPLEPNFIAATDSPEKIKKFANSIMAMVSEYGFDGVDMDWEHPRVDGNTSKQYEALMLNLANQLHAKKKLLTAAVLSGVSADGTVMYDAAAHHDSVLNAVDWINVMAYDGGDGDRHSSFDFHVNSGNYWIKNRKMNKNKVCVGVPFYGRPSWESYDNLLAANPSADTTDISSIRGIQAHYNGVATIEKKSKWNKENCGGVMVWEVTQDTLDKKKSLLSAIGRAIK